MHPRTLLLTLVLAAAAVHGAPADDALKQGQALFRDGKLHEAAEALEKATELAPGNAEAHHLLGATYGRQAEAASMFGKMRLAGRIKDEFERAVALAPETVDYRESLLTFYLAAPAVAGGGIDKAKVQATEIAKRDPVRGELAWASIAMAEDKPDEALGAWYQLGRTAVLSGTHLAEGEAALKRYLAGTPGAQDPPLAAAHWRLDPAHAESRAALEKLK